MEAALLNEFKEHSCFRLKEGQRMIHLAFKTVDDFMVWELPFSGGMCLGNQLLHIAGNMTQYIISSLGQIKDERQRALEFSANGGKSKEELLQLLDTTAEAAIKTIEKAHHAEFLKARKVQGFEFSGVGVVLHAVEHFSYHVGQIAFWVKLLTGNDLGFYAHHNLSQLNE
ncbi:MAG: DUF1572 domain-containing protein [Flavobacteriaceae bacterium]|nr:DUF1572 domain-containing protein [Flavobacteriaceae bacterium]